jgi:peptidoglycan/LPS O-acetylase OafA/YrhL
VGVPPKRDSFIDGLRALSVARVIGLHLLQRAEHPFIVVFSFFMPGMPLLFFVSGTLAAHSLSREGDGVRKRFWISRGRRLMLPFWAFSAVIVSTCLVGRWLWNDAAHQFSLSMAWRWVVPLAGPQTSPAYDKLDWHLWFLSTLMLMLGTAPWTLALHKRVPWLGAAVLFTAGAMIEFLAIPVPDVVRNALLFGAVFQLGYGFADGRVQTLRPGTLFGAAFCLAAFALAFYAQRSWGQMLHAVPLATVCLGLAFVAAWLACRPTAKRAFENGRVKPWIGAINRRAYTIYLWGPVANDIAWRAVQPKTGGAYALDFAIALSLLFVFVRILGPIEDWAARREARPAPDGTIVPRERQAA